MCNQTSIRLFICSFAILHCWVVAVKGHAQTRRITTYIEDVQEERRSTRWTLTEWLRIKERMKLMDLWLAMFSGPKQPKFAPELMLDYQLLSSDLSLGISDLNNQAEFELKEQTMDTPRLQFWFTNLVSATTGLPTLNIDLGFELSRRSYPEAGEDEQGVPVNPIALDNGLNLRLNAGELDYGTVNFRIFGRNIQDSSLILKAGSYEYKTGILAGDQIINKEGMVAGGESYLYLLNWLGVDGELLRFGNGKGAAGSPELEGQISRYGLFIEIFLLRIGYSLVEESWSFQEEAFDYQSDWKGTAWTVRLSL